MPFFMMERPPSSDQVPMLAAPEETPPVPSSTTSKEKFALLPHLSKLKINEMKNLRNTRNTCNACNHGGHGALRHRERSKADVHREAFYFGVASTAKWKKGWGNSGLFLTSEPQWAAAAFFVLSFRVSSSCPFAFLATSDLLLKGQQLSFSSIEQSRFFLYFHQGHQGACKQSP